MINILNSKTAYYQNDITSVLLTKANKYYQNDENYQNYQYHQNYIVIRNYPPFIIQHFTKIQTSPFTTETSAANLLNFKIRFQQNFTAKDFKNIAPINCPSA